MTDWTTLITNEGFCSLSRPIFQTAFPGSDPVIFSGSGHKFYNLGVRSLLAAAAIICTPLAAFGQEFPANGHQLYLHCEGKPATFTVILIAGGGGATDTWDKVQSPISKFAQVCSYDRWGLGKSDPLPSGGQQSVAEIVADLAVLLKEARLRPPYLLVGHSIGGLYARAFDDHFDIEVAGMILLDSSHEEQIWRFAKSEPDALKEYPRWQDQRYMLSQGFLPPGKHLKWRFNKPLIVIEHGAPPEPVWHEMQLDLASRSSQSRFVTATQSSHYIQKLQPQLVIDAVHTLEESHGSLGVFRKPERGATPVTVENRVNDRVLAALRIAVGVFFCVFGEYKVFDTEFTLHGGFQDGVRGFLTSGSAYPLFVPCWR